MMPAWIIPVALAITIQTTPIRVEGRASWYDNGGGLYAAAGPALRHGNWRGSKVRVCNTYRCVTVRLTDWCQCYRNTRTERVIDLSRSAFSRLSPLTRGLTKVTITPVTP
jgi:rare lipoprotein A (peptidoglycan hydrolase)